jgi:hypothetical protein
MLTIRNVMFKYGLGNWDVIGCPSDLLKSVRYETFINHYVDIGIYSNNAMLTRNPWNTLVLHVENF